MSNFHAMGRLKTKFEQVVVSGTETVWIPSLKRHFPIDEVEFEDANADRNTGITEIATLPDNWKTILDARIAIQTLERVKNEIPDAHFPELGCSPHKVLDEMIAEHSQVISPK